MALLTSETVIEFAQQQLAPLGPDSPLATTVSWTAHEIEGGNLNYAFCVRDNSGGSVFVKQAPDFIKVFGKDAKLSRERMRLEVSVYKKWELTVGEEVAASFLPRIYAFDEASMAFVMEFLESYVLLQEDLYSGIACKAVAAAAGRAMGLIHLGTHCTLIQAAEAAILTEEYQNRTLREVQLEYVFTKPFREAERAADLREDAAFMAELENIKAKYRGENKSDLSLVHGDLHPGSIMADRSAGRIKFIDPEFAIYGPPGLDVGSVLSGYALACVLAAFQNPSSKTPMLLALSELWASYAQTMEAGGIDSGIISSIGKDGVAFAGCEIARTALGFAGVRGLPLADEALKAKAEAAAIALAHRCITGAVGDGRGVHFLVEALEQLPVEG